MLGATAHPMIARNPSRDNAEAVYRWKENIESGKKLVTICFQKDSWKFYPTNLIFSSHLLKFKLETFASVSSPSVWRLQYFIFIILYEYIICIVFEKKKAPCLTVCYSPKKTLKNLCLTCYVPVSGQGFLPTVTKKVGGGGGGGKDRQRKHALSSTGLM